MTVRLDDKVALVTGATAGVGRGIAEALLDRGARVVGVGRRREVGERVEAELCERGHGFMFLQGDVAESDDCRRVVDETVDRYGRIDILINNVGIGDPINPVEKISDAEWDAVIRPSLDGMRKMSRAALPTMQSQRDGVIISISSVGGIQALANLGAYGAAKAAIMQLTRSIAVENLAYGVRANSVVLGFVAGTDQSDRISLEMGRQLYGSAWMPDPALNPGALGKGAMSPKAVGRAIAVLCSDDAREINATTVSMDRGFTAGFLATAMFYLGLAGALPDLQHRELGAASP